MSQQNKPLLPHQQKTLDSTPRDPVTGEKLKICCVCPDTRTKRDECIIMKGQEECKEFIDQHTKCLRDLGFKV
eukprot:g73515.t1